MTQVTRHYLQKFLFRLCVFGLILALYLAGREYVDFTSEWSAGRLVTPAGVLWLVVMFNLLAHLDPRSKLTAGCTKQFSGRFLPVGAGYDMQQVRRSTRKQDISALKVLIVWLAVNGLFGILYRMGILTVAELVLLCALCYVCDLVCVLFFCPFQFFLMKNRCCVTCRIFAWGGWMMVAPLMAVPHLYAQSLVAVSLVVLVCWEIRYRRWPERFCEVSNALLQCANCAEKLCHYKKMWAKTATQEEE